MGSTVLGTDRGPRQGACHSAHRLISPTVLELTCYFRARSLQAHQGRGSQNSRLSFGQQETMGVHSFRFTSQMPVSYNSPYSSYVELNFPCVQVLFELLVSAGQDDQIKGQMRGYPQDNDQG